MIYDHQILLSLQQKEIEHKAKHAWKWYQRNHSEQPVKVKQQKVKEASCQPVHMTCCTSS